VHVCPLPPSPSPQPPSLFQVITREVDGVKCEPYEEAVVEVPEQYVGGIVELFAQRKGEMVDMQPSIEVRHRQQAASSRREGWCQEVNCQ